MNENFERFVSDTKHELAHCLRGRLHEFDMPSRQDADQLKEQFENFYQVGEACEEIDWKALEKQLSVFANEVIVEYCRRKQIEDREEAVRAGRL